MDEPELDEIVQQFWRIESREVQTDSKPSSPLDQKFIQIMKDSINLNGQRFEIQLPWEKTHFWNIIIYPPSIKSKAWIGDSSVILNFMMTIEKHCKLIGKKLR